MAAISDRDDGPWKQEAFAGPGTCNCRCVRCDGWSKESEEFEPENMRILIPAPYGTLHTYVYDVLYMFIIIYICMR